MKAKGNQLCDSCKLKPTCQDYADNMKIRSEGLSIQIIECDMHVPLKISNLA